MSSPAWDAISVHTPVFDKLVTRKFGAAVTTATVHKSGVSEVIVTANPVAELSDRLYEVAVKSCVLLVNIVLKLETVMN